MTVRRIGANGMGLLSILIVGYFWFALLVRHAWQPVFPGAGFLVIGTVVSALVMSIIAGAAGSRRWYFVSALAFATFLFIGFGMR